MNKMIVAFAAVAAMTLSVGVAEAGSKNKQTGQFTSGGLVNVSPNVSVGGILNGGVLNGAAILSGNTTGVGILGTGILSSSKTIKNSFNDNSKNKKR
jgi:hypothetical protein